MDGFLCRRKSSNILSLTKISGFDILTFSLTDFKYGWQITNLRHMTTKTGCLTLGCLTIINLIKDHNTQKMLSILMFLRFYCCTNFCLLFVNDIPTKAVL